MIGRKTYRKTYSKKRKFFGGGKILLYTRNGPIYLGGGFPIGALFSAATLLLGPALFKKTIKKKMRRKDNYVMMKRATSK